MKNSKSAFEKFWAQWTELIADDIRNGNFKIPFTAFQRNCQLLKVKKFDRLFNQQLTISKTGTETREFVPK